MMTICNDQIYLKIKRLENFDQAQSIPSYETEGAAGADLRASLKGMPNEKQLIIRPKERVLVPTGLSLEIPIGYEVQIRPRSGISFKTSLMVLNSPGTIDSDYRGEVKIIMGNLGDKDEVINHGDRIAQMVIAKVTRAKFSLADELTSTERGSGGFGSTGK